MWLAQYRRVPFPLDPSYGEEVVRAVLDGRRRRAEALEIIGWEGIGSETEVDGGEASLLGDVVGEAPQEAAAPGPGPQELGRGQGVREYLRERVAVRVISGGARWDRRLSRGDLLMKTGQEMYALLQRRNTAGTRKRQRANR